MEKETPNKIYLYPSRLKKGKILGRWFMTRYNQDSVEYIRKDAFIEKAADYIKKDMLDNLAFQDRLNRIEIIDGIIEKFIKAMKGE